MSFKKCLHRIPLRNEGVGFRHGQRNHFLFQSGCMPVDGELAVSAEFLWENKWIPLAAKALGEMFDDSL